MNVMLLLASLACFITFAVHTFVGSPHAVPPLLRSRDVTTAARWLNVMCWHMITALLLILTVALAAVAASRGSRDVAVLVAVICACLSLVSVATTLRAGIKVRRFPASYLLAIVAVLAAIGSQA